MTQVQNLQNGDSMVECIVRHDVRSVPLPRPVALAVATNLRKAPEIDTLREVLVVKSITAGKSIVCVKLTGTLTADYTAMDYGRACGDQMSIFLDAILDSQVRLAREIRAVSERQAA